MVFTLERNSMMHKFMLGLAAAAAVVLQTTAFAESPAAEEAKTNRLLVKAQKICPVSGKGLTEMGGPVKAEIGKESLFLCCKACFGGQILNDHWDQIQANLKKAQGKCPVMGKPLPEKTLSTVVKGRRVFVCCPPCTNKIEADPKRYLAKVDKLLEENLGGEDRLQQ